MTAENLQCCLIFLLVNLKGSQLHKLLETRRPSSLRVDYISVHGQRRDEIRKSCVPEPFVIRAGFWKFDSPARSILHSEAHAVGEPGKQTGLKIPAAHLPPGGPAGQTEKEDKGQPSAPPQQSGQTVHQN